MSRLDELSARLHPQDKLARLGQALWMKIGCALKKEELIWAKGILGEDGDALVWDCLLEEGVVASTFHEVDSYALSRFFGRLSCKRGPEASSGVLWTLPKALSETVSVNSYSEAMTNLIEAATASVILVSPYIEAKGVGALLDPLLKAMMRGAYITVVTHHAEDISSRTSLALKVLCRETAWLPGRLTVYSAVKEHNVLLHSKLVIRDRALAIVGSANLTEPGLDSNLEAGVVLGQDQTHDICKVVDALIASPLVEKRFSIRADDCFGPVSPLSFSGSPYLLRPSTGPMLLLRQISHHSANRMVNHDPLSCR